ncbi:hypothetical protein [Fulvivirga sp.]|uniref:hypothetical protein n=1 Tax=Fulvivirga sp. TaxID=1931237 RepID=UPI0032ED9A18
MNKNNIFRNTAVKFGAILGSILIAIFLAMEVLLLVQSLAIRILDVVIIYLIVGRSLHYYQLHSSEGHSYLRNLGLGVATSFFGMLLFALFLAAYLSLINQGYMNFLKEVLPMGPYLNPIIIGLFLLIEGVGIGALSGFIQALMIKKMEL